MATFNTTTINSVDVLSSSFAAAAAAAAAAQQQQFEQSANIGASSTTTTTTYLVPSTTVPLQLEPFSTTAQNYLNAYPLQQHHNQNQHQQTNSSSTASSYKFVQIKREPCQVSEISSNCHQNIHSPVSQRHHTVATSSSSSSSSTTSTHQQHNSVGSVSSTSKTMSSSSTLTTLVKIEQSSPKLQEMDKTSTSTTLTATSNSVPIGIAVARKRQQETSSSSSSNSLQPLCNSNTLPLQQQQLNKDLNCIGIRVSDLGAVSTGCGNFYFTGGGDLMSSSTTAEELALNAAGVHSVNRASSTFWQYPNALPIESVISMSPATVGLQYSRDANRGQVVLLPATAAALDPFQQAAAALVWPSYIPQGNPSAALQTPPNFIFPSMSSHSTLQATQPYATSLQLFGSNYLTAAAAAAAAAAATSTLCQHNQQTNTSATNSINLSVGTAAGGTASSSTMCSSSTSSRFLSIAAASAPMPSDFNKQSYTAHGKTAAVAHQQTAQTALNLPPPPPVPVPTTSLIMPPSSMKIEEWNATEFMTSAGKTTTTTLAHQHNSLISSSSGAANQLSSPAPSAPQPLALNFETRDAKTTTTTTTTTNLLDLQGTTQALNLMRLPTPPSSATLESSAAAAVNATQLQQHLLFQGAPPTTLLNLSTTTMPRAATTNGNGFLNSGSPSIGPPTPISDDLTMGFKNSAVEASTNPQMVVGVPRIMPVNPVTSAALTEQTPQMQDVNIQTDTPVCSDDDSSSCTMTIQQQSLAPVTPPPEPASSTVDGDEVEMNDGQAITSADSPQPLELTKQHNDANEAESSVNECHISNTQTNYRVQSTNLNEQQAEVASEAPSIPLQETVKLSLSTNNLSQPTNSSEDMTGLELLSNISTSTLAKSSSDINANEEAHAKLCVRVKQEPIDMVIEEESQEVITSNNMRHEATSSTTPTTTRVVNDESQQTAELMTAEQQSQPPAQAIVEPLGGLSLLCALAEQRIQEEVQSGGSNGLFGSTSATDHERERQTTTFNFATTSIQQQQHQLQQLQEQLQQSVAQFGLDNQQSSFPSMEGIELPSTSGVDINEPVKRKKHKHSKTSKSSSSSGKKSQRCSKKSKKKMAKEKRKHKSMPLPPTADELDFEDEQLQDDLRNALKAVDPKFQNTNNWPNPQEIFNIMEQNMRMRLADITRQYRKKKRKLDEMSKNKKKKKCSKLAAAQREREREQQLTPIQQSTSTLSLSGSSVLALHANGSSALSAATSSLCDYKFSKFGATSVGVGGSTAAKHSSYLQPSSFLRFAEKSHSSFPPIDCDLGSDHDKELATTSAISTSILKPVRLDPSALAAASKQRNAHSALRLAQKHSSSESSSHIIVSKERKLMSCSGARHSSGDDAEEINNPSIAMTTTPTTTKTKSNKKSKRSLINPMDRELTLTSEHLYRDETRVLTDMGGLFYAGIMKPLQPPDIYSITLDGERGNKSHIMSREEIFKDTILEVAPKSVESLPVGTRLCAYWSQQYRCLYPGRVIESESSDDGTLPNDFVSVEFDDGDSGRIRLQNIRMLLSNYPIAEYNDNPLYSLGKQKKNKSQTGSNNNLNEAHHKHQNEPLPIPAGSVEQYSCTGVEMYARRTEKKRSKKSLKKKLLAEKQLAAAAAQQATTATTTTTTTSTILSNGHQMLKTCTTNAAATTLAASGEAEQNDNQRKHHKHKKRKKHKKHHHRKNNAMETTTGGDSGKCYMIAPVPLPYKRELPVEDEYNEDDDDAVDDDNYANEPNNNIASMYDERGETTLLVGQQQRTQSARSTGGVTLSLTGGGGVTAPAGATIKLESSAIGADASGLNVGCTGLGFKVKTENLDIEEETTSNLMSEISDEAKTDDAVEHNNSKGSSKIAAFLPERQLWGWYGTAYRKAGVKGRARKQFYKTIKRGKETITVGECAVFLSTGRPDRPYIGRIESMWETTSGNRVVRVRWFYHPEETTGCPSLQYPGALFESPHEDENDVQTISHRCEVLEFLNYFGKFGADSKQYQSIYDNNDTYYLAGYYNPRLKVLKLQDDIPTLEEQNTITNINNNNNCNDYDNDNDNEKDDNV